MTTKILRKNPLTAGLESGQNTTSLLLDASFCPVCNIKMNILTANNIPTYVCMTHRVSFPVKDNVEG